jgi:hypothetical protein
VDDHGKGILGRQVTTNRVRGRQRPRNLIGIVRADEMNRLAAQDQHAVRLHIKVATDRHIRAAEHGEQKTPGKHRKVVLNGHQPCVNGTGAGDIQIGIDTKATDPLEQVESPWAAPALAPFWAEAASSVRSLPVSPFVVSEHARTGFENGCPTAAGDGD